MVEGAGLHACEYMTRGTVVFLGPVSHNAGAGMTGGQFYLDRHHDGFVNRNYVHAVALEPADALEVQALLQDYLAATGSPAASALLADWEATLGRFSKYVPVAPAAKAQAEQAPSGAEAAGQA